MNKGVTLIALILTIIVLLILSGITIIAVIGEDGVLTRAVTADQKFSKAEMEEAFGMLINDLLIEGYAKSQESQNLTIDDCFNEKIVLDFLLDKENGLEENYGYIRIPDETITDDKMVLPKNDGEKIYPLYYINLSNISSKNSKYGIGTNIDSGNVYTLEVQTEDITNDDGTVSKKSTGIYALKYYDNESNPPETLSTYYFIPKK